MKTKKMGKALSWTLLTFLLTFTLGSYTDAQTCVRPPTGLISWWPGDGNANDVQDSNHGFPQNGATFGFGLVGQAFSFDGVDDSVHVPNSASLTITGEFTIEFWFNPTITITPANPTAPGLFSKGKFDSINLANDDGRLEVRGPFPRPNSTTNEWLAGTWYHIAVTFDTASYKIYVNGILEGGVPSTYSIMNNANDIALGSIPGFPPSIITFNGLIDEMSLYNRALAASEIQATFNAGSAGKCKPPSLALTLTGCTTCRAGNQFTVQAHVTNPGSRDVPVEAKIGVRLPDRTPINLLGNKHLEVPLPAGLDTTFTLFDFPLPDGLPTGTWSLEGTLLGPELGETFSRDVKTFDVVP